MGKILQISIYQRKQVWASVSLFHTWTLFRLRVPALTTSKFCFEPSATCKQCPKFRDIQFVRWNASSRARPSVVHFNTQPQVGCISMTLYIYCVSSPAYRFPVPYLDTFSIAGSWTNGIKIVFRIFCDLQTVPEVLRYTICLQECTIIPSSVLHILRSTLPRDTI